MVAMLSHLLLSTFIWLGSSSYLWDLYNDPTETNNLYDDADYYGLIATLKDRVDSWQDTLVRADTTDSSYESKENVWDECGGICPYVDNDYSLEIEQLYFAEDPPHVIFILVDDWGWNDVGFRSTYMNWTTPTIDSLAAEGIIMGNYFTHSFCVPSRGALMTGRFAGRLGLLEDIDGNELPLTEITLAQELKSAGYRTHMIGKWHLGCSSNARLPTYRGFDSFYGYYNGFMDYYSKAYSDYLDLHDGASLVTDTTELSTDLHSALLFQSKAEAVINDHAAEYPDTPLFLYYSMQLMHFPYEAPSEYTGRCSGDFNADRYSDYEQYCGMSLMLDEAIANLTCTLSNNDMLDNTVLIIASDNGGEESIPGDSEPFRGHKYDFSRGGVGATAFITSRMIPDEARGTVYTGQMHVTDWLPTIMSLATDFQWTGSYSSNTTIDGVDMWAAILTNASSPRREIVHYVNSEGEASLQVDMMKLDLDLALADYDNFSTVFSHDWAPDMGVYKCEDPSVVDVEIEIPAMPTRQPTQAPTKGKHSKHHKSKDRKSSAEKRDDDDDDDDGGGGGGQNDDNKNDDADDRDAGKDNGNDDGDTNEDDKDVVKDEEEGDDAAADEDDFSTSPPTFSPSAYSPDSKDVDEDDEAGSEDVTAITSDSERHWFRVTEESLMTSAAVIAVMSVVISFMIVQVAIARSKAGQ